MLEYSLKGEKRTEIGKKYARKFRAQGLIPCNLIGKDGAISFVVKAADLRNLIYTSHVYAVNLEIDGATCKAIIKEAQFGPVNEELLHLDFLKFDEGDQISVAVPVKLEGHAEGVKAGGKLLKRVRTLTVKGNWTNIPDRLIVDVSALELGKTLKVEKLSFDQLEIITPKEVIVAAVKATRASRAK